MVDVSRKAPTHRVARAAATVHMTAETMDKIRQGHIGKWQASWLPRKTAT
mgnify:CR=1 FL=1